MTRVYLAFGLVLLVLMVVILRVAPVWIAALYAGMGLVSFLAYWRDKRLAASGAWRIPETTLHGLDFCGGIIGGLLAQHLVRHKTAKRDFALVSYGIAGVHVLALCIFLAAALPGA